MIITREIVNEKYEILEAASQAVADALNEGLSEKDMKPFKERVKVAEQDYNTANEEYWYNMLIQEHGDNAIVEGIRRFYIPNAKKSVRKLNKTGKYVSTITNRETPIDLVSFMDLCGPKWFAAGNWFDKVCKFAYVIANAINKNLGEDPDFQYMVSDSAKAFGFAEDANPASANSGRKALQACVDAIAFIPSENNAEVNAICCTKQHWHFIRETISRHGKKKLSVTIMTAEGVTGLIAEVMSGVLCDNHITVKADE